MKSVQFSILDLRQRTLMHSDQMRSIGKSSDLNLNNEKIINIMNDILEDGNFNFRNLYAPGIIKEKNSVWRFLSRKAKNTR